MTTFTLQQKLALLKTAGMEKEALTLGTFEQFKNMARAAKAAPINGSMRGGSLATRLGAGAGGVARLAGGAADRLGSAAEMAEAGYRGPLGITRNAGILDRVGYGLGRAASLDTPFKRLAVPLAAGAAAGIGIPALTYYGLSGQGASPLLAGAASIGLPLLGGAAGLNYVKSISALKKMERLRGVSDPFIQFARGSKLKPVAKMTGDELEDAVSKFRASKAGGSFDDTHLDELKGALNDPMALPQDAGLFNPSTWRGSLGEYMNWVGGAGSTEKQLGGFRNLQNLSEKRFLNMPRVQPEDKGMGNFSKAMLGLAGIHAAPKILPWGRSEED